ncbi:MAG: hypothetical protein ABH914_02690 [Candidatus Omnitrophota bacterium]
MKKFKIKKLNTRELIKKITPHVARIKQDKNKLIPAIAVICLILFLDLFYFLRPQIRACGAVGSKITTLRKDLDNLNADLVMMQRYESGVGLGEIKKMVPFGQLPGVIE